MYILGTVALQFNVLLLGIPITHSHLRYVLKTSQCSKYIGMQKHVILVSPQNPYHHATMPPSPYGILFVGIWVLIQPISISFNPTNIVNNIKIIFLHDKCQFGQLSYESIWFHQKLKELMINNQGERQTFPWVIPLGTTLPKSQENWTQLKKLKFHRFTYTLVYLIRLGKLCFPCLCTHSWKIMNTQKPIRCINILILEPFLTQFMTFFSFKCFHIYTLVIFSCLFSACTREWSKLVIKTTKGENSYHLCFWHQWPFKTSWSWLQKFIAKW